MAQGYVYIYILYIQVNSIKKDQKARPVYFASTLPNGLKSDAEVPPQRFLGRFAYP